MSVFKRGKTYWYEFIFDGRRIQRSTKQRNRQAAIDIESAYRTALAKGEVGIVDRKPVPSFSVFAKRFREEMVAVHAAKPKTVAHYCCGLKKLLEFEPFNVRLDRIDSELISRYVEWRRAQKYKRKLYEVSTVNRQIEVLRRMLHLAVEWKILPSAPKISRLPGENQRDRIVTHEEERRYLAAAEPLLREVSTILLDTGLRPDECFRMRWENVFFEPAGAARYGRIFVPTGKTKNARRNVPLTARAKAFLSMRSDTETKEGWVFPAPTRSGHIETSTLRRAHAAAIMKSGVKPFVPYSLRHTMLTRLGEAGADPFAIQKIAGHHSIVISQRYVHPSPERIEGAFTLLESYNRNEEKKLSGLIQYATSLQFPLQRRIEGCN